MSYCVDREIKKTQLKTTLSSLACAVTMNEALIS